MDLKSLASKKVAGIPVMYLAAAAVVIGLIYAVKMKSTTTTTDTTGEDATAGPGDAGNAPSNGADYSGLDSTGTVVVQPQEPATTDTTVETNDTWGKAAINYLISINAGTPGAITEAISAYLDGAHLTYEQGLLRDKAVTKLGPPPSIPSVGGTDSQPAQKQFSAFPGTHTVKGVNDNTPGKLANLYYGNADSLHVDLIVEQNLQYGPKTTTYTAGTKVKIPAYAGPKFYTTTKSVRTLSAVASKNGLSLQQIQALNPLRSDPLPVGMRIRVG